MTRSEKGSLAAMIVFSVLMLMEYLNKCMTQTHGFSVATGIAAAGMLIAGLLFVLKGRPKDPQKEKEPPTVP